MKCDTCPKKTYTIYICQDGKKRCPACKDKLNDTDHCESVNNNKPKQEK
jgi:hypothetical protein